MVDTVTGWRMYPSHQFSIRSAEFQTTYRSNAQGFRGDSDFDAEETRKKIVLIGDSMAFGVGVQYEETYGAVIAAQRPDVVVYNLSMPGFGLDQMWLSVRHHALPLRPDLVLVGFIGDDFTRSLFAYRLYEGFNKPIFKVMDGRLVPKTPEDRPPVLVYFFARHSHAWTAGELALRLLKYYVPFGEWWTLNAAILDAIRHDCQTHNVPLLFIYYPSKRWLKFPSLRAYMQQVGAHFVDLTEETPPSLQPSLHYPRDGHLNVQGHRYVAEVVLRWLRQHMTAL